MNEEQKNKIFVDCNTNKEFREYMDKEFEVCPGWTISRTMYEDFPCPLQAWNWSDEKMNELAQRIADEFEPIAYDNDGEEHKVKYSDDIPLELENGFEWLGVEFYTAIENNAVRMGMRYYEDFTDEEMEQDFIALGKFLKGFLKENP